MKEKPQPHIHFFDQPHVYEDQYIRSTGHILGPPILDGNRFASLHNGNQIFPAMLNAIEEAEVSITLETFIYWSGEVGTQFAEALSKKAREGVAVRVLIDWLGSRTLDTSLIDQMERAGVRVRFFHPLRWYLGKNPSRLNHRTHRKVMVVDGKVGFTGGVGIADNWMGQAQDPHHWRDSHFKVEGPTVAHLQSVFVDNWVQTCKEVLCGKEYFPNLKPVGQGLAQVFKSSPREGSASVRLMYLMALASASQSIRISTPYFVPDSEVVARLLTARERGVEVEVIVPGPYIDHRLAKYGSQSIWGPLLENGVRIYAYQPTMYHYKAVIVDNYWVSVGSTNLDQRSLYLNDEANLNIFDKEMACHLAGVFEQDKQSCKEVTYASWKKRPLKNKMRDVISSLFNPLL